MAVDLRRALMGRPSMRRELAGLGQNRVAEIAKHFEGRDPVRDRAFIRRDLEAILRNEQAMAPILARRSMQERLNDPKTPRNDVQTLRQNLRESRSTVNEQRNPLRWGSAARQRFGSLYRKI